MGTGVELCSTVGDKSNIKSPLGFCEWKLGGVCVCTSRDYIAVATTYVPRFIREVATTAIDHWGDGS